MSLSLAFAKQHSNLDFSKSESRDHACLYAVPGASQPSFQVGGYETSPKVFSASQFSPSCLVSYENGVNQNPVLNGVELGHEVNVVEVQW